ncbi:MAG: tetratricopeptide repeat protein, partial [Muribaculaceae bacterium]|nr:tetratricopeptide repeat protein [Muribaculaceae bacterium]
TMSAQGYQDGVDYYNANYPDEAQIILDRTFNDASTDKAVANYYLGQLALDNGNVSKAAKYYNDGVAANADCPYNYIGLGAIELKKGNKKEAEEYFKRAQNIDKKDAEILTMIARVYYNVNPQLYDKDITKLLEKATKMNVKEPTIYILQADMVKAENVGDAAGKYEAAMDFDREADKDGNIEIVHPESYIKYAKLYENINPQYSIERLKELLEVEPNSAMAQRELAEAYYANRYYTPAAEQYGTYIKNPNSFQKDRQRYVGLLNFGKKYQESYDLANQILSEDPGNIYMERMKFLDMVDMKNYEQAVKDAEVFFANPKAKDKFIANDYVQYGNALQALGQDSLALIQMAAAVQIAPEESKADMLRNLSESQSKAKMYKEAAASQQQLIDMG